VTELGGFAKNFNAAQLHGFELATHCGGPLFT
jgi:hypothetical protein